MVHELAAVNGMKAANDKRKLLQHRFQQRLQPSFANGWRAAHHLPLRHFVHSVDVIYALHSLPVALMYCLHSHVTTASLRLGPAPLANGNRRRPGHAEPHTPLATHLLL